ncbi:alpha/beta hydrolase family protein [Vibrio breoganii]
MNHVCFSSKGSEVEFKGRFIKSKKETRKSPLVIMLTGDGRKGSKSFSWTNIPPRLQGIGVSSFLFDFQGLGYSDGRRETLTVSRGIENFKAAWEEILKADWVDHDNISFFASSFGATVLLLCPEIANQAKSIGLKSPAAFLPDAYFNEIGAEHFDKWRVEGYLPENGYDFSVFTDSLFYNVFSSANCITTPCLITQGDRDEVIPVQQTLYLYESLSSNNKQLVIFEGVGHGYHEGDSFERMAEMFVTSFKKRMTLL